MHNCLARYRIWIEIETDTRRRDAIVCFSTRREQRKFGQAKKYFPNVNQVSMACHANYTHAVEQHGITEKKIVSN